MNVKEYIKKFNDLRFMVGDHPLIMEFVSDGSDCWWVCIEINSDNVKDFEDAECIILDYHKTVPVWEMEIFLHPDDQLIEICGGDEC